MNDDVMTEYADFVDESVIEKYMSFEKKLSTKLSPWKSWYTKVLTAACACVVLFVLGIILLNKFPSNEAPYFVLKAYAANGELYEIDVNGTLNSVSNSESEKNMFGVDFPLFEFYITLADENDNRMKFSDVYISVYRNGKDIIAANDKQISILYYFPSTGYDLPSGFCVMGWSEEPTDVTINIIDHKTDEIIESFMLNICFIHDSGEYLITVNEIKTNHTVMYEIQKYLK